MEEELEGGFGVGSVVEVEVGVVGGTGLGGEACVDGEVLVVGHAEELGEGFEGLFGAEFIVEVVQDGDVVEEKRRREVGAEEGIGGAKVGEVEADVLAEKDGVGTATEDMEPVAETDAVVVVGP